MVHELTRVISESGGNISESRMANLGTEFAMLLLVSGNWHALAKLETELKRLAETSNLSIHLKRHRAAYGAHRHAAVFRSTWCALIRAASSRVSRVSSPRAASTSRSLDPQLPGRAYRRPHVRVQMIVNVPSRIHVAHLREEFMEFCDSLNLDAILEPVKS